MLGSRTLATRLYPKIERAPKIVIRDRPVETDELIAILKQSPKILSLINVELQNTSRSVRLIANQLLFPDWEIEYLDLRHDSIFSSGINLILKSIKQNRTVKYLDLSMNVITPAGIDLLIEALESNQVLRIVRIGMEYIPVGAEKLIPILKKSSLKRFDIYPTATERKRYGYQLKRSDLARNWVITKIESIFTS